ncbi:MAG: pyridoxal phosphate-dependent aminotransferase [Desulfobacterales bacterium]
MHQEDVCRINPDVATIPMSKREAIWKAMHGRDNLANLASGNPDMAMPQPVRNAMREHVAEGYARYTEYYGLKALREGISSMLERDWSLPADSEDQIIVTCGVQQGLYIVMRSILNPGDEVIIPSPHYGSYYQNTLACGAKPVLVPLTESDNFEPDFERLAAAVSTKSRAIVFCNPNNPLGVVWSHQTLKSLADFAQAHDLLVLVDEIYRDYTFNGPPLSVGSLPGMAQRTFTFGGFSKSHLMMGLRIGFVAGPPALMHAVKKLHYCVVLCPSAISQAAASAALECTDAELAPIRNHFAAQLDRLYRRVQALPGVSCAAPGGGFYVFPNFSRYGSDAMAFAIRLIEEAGVVTLPGTEFGELGQGHLRLSVCAAEAEVSEGIQRLETFIHEQHG